MIELNLIEGWIEVLLTLVLITGAFIVTRRDLLSVVSAYRVQSVLLVFIAVLLYLIDESPVLLYLAVLTLVSKVFVIPSAIKSIQKRIGIKRDLEFHYLSPIGSLFASILIFLFVYFLFSILLEDLFQNNKLLYTGAVFGVSLLLMGMVVTFSRKKIITKIIGYLAMENGVLMFGLFLTELPFIIEVLIIVDLVILVLLSAMLAVGIDSSIEEFHKRLHPFKGRFSGMTAKIRDMYSALGTAVPFHKLLSKSHKKMQFFTALHALAYFLIAMGILVYVNLPVSFFDEKYIYIDYLSIYEILIASAIFFFAAMYLGGYVEGLMTLGELSRKDLNVFYVAFNALLIATVLAFLSNNIALFWIFAELTTVFSALLIAILNSKKNIDAALKYVFITSTAMLFSFVGIMLLFELSQHAVGTGTLNWDALMQNAKNLPETILLASFVFIFIGFAAKSGIAPFHTWLPHAHSKAPSAVSAILSAVILNVGVYGIIRIYSVVRQTDAEPFISQFMICFGLFTIFVAAFTMLRQSDFKKLIAFSSVEHIGIVSLGIGIGTPVALFWVLFHTLSHSLTKALLFLSAGILHRQYLSNKAENMINAFRLQPVASIGLVLGGIAIVGMPPFPLFLSELSILLEAVKVSVPLVFAALILLLIASVSIALFMIKLFSNVSEKEEYIEKYTAPFWMKAPIIALIIIIFLLGIFIPEGLRNLLENITLSLGF